MAAVGIGAFGLVNPEPASRTYGYINSTPKPGWQEVDLRDWLAGALGVPVAFDTDVNVAAFGAHRWARPRTWTPLSI